jgi:hypothetical protein
VVLSPPAVGGADAGPNTSASQDLTPAPPITTVEDQNMEEERSSEVGDAFTSLEDSAAYIDPRLKPVDRIIKVNSPGTGEF